LTGAARQTFMSVLFALLCTGPAGAQSLDKTTVDSIVGSEVKEERTTAAASEDKVIEAIDRTAANAALVRKTSGVDQVDIVLLGGTTRGAGGLPPRISQKLKQHESEVVALRQEIESNALLFHAIDSRRVLTANVLAVDFPDDRTVVIYAAAQPAG